VATALEPELAPEPVVAKAAVNSAGSSRHAVWASVPDAVSPLALAPTELHAALRSSVPESVSALVQESALDCSGLPVAFLFRG
jgi:hypothetical protein